MRSKMVSVLTLLDRVNNLSLNCTKLENLGLLEDQSVFSVGQGQESMSPLYEKRGAYALF